MESSETSSTFLCTDPRKRQGGVLPISVQRRQAVSLRETEPLKARPRDRNRRELEDAAEGLSQAHTKCMRRWPQIDRQTPGVGGWRGDLSEPEL